MQERTEIYLKRKVGRKNRRNPVVEICGGFYTLSCDIIERIAGAVVDMHLKVQVVAGGIAGHADKTDQIALRYLIAN